MPCSRSVCLAIKKVNFSACAQKWHRLSSAPSTSSRPVGWNRCCVSIRNNIRNKVDDNKTEGLRFRAMVRPTGCARTRPHLSVGVACVRRWHVWRPAQYRYRSQAPLSDQQINFFRYSISNHNYQPLSFLVNACMLRPMPRSVHSSCEFGTRPQPQSEMKT